MDFKQVFKKLTNPKSLFVNFFGLFFKASLIDKMEKTIVGLNTVTKLNSYQPHWVVHHVQGDNYQTHFLRI